MSGDLCPGGGKGWEYDPLGARPSTRRCPECRRAKDVLVSPASAQTVPPHTVDRATGELWVQATPPKPPDPDPWAVALLRAYSPAFAPEGATLEHFTRVATEARRLAATDPAIRAAHWREMAGHLDGCGYPSSPTEARHQADLIEQGGRS